MRLNRKIIMGIVLLLILSVLGGCKSKPPEGVSQEFYDDMVKCLKKLEKYKDNKDKNGIDTIKYYLENKLWLNTREEEIITAISDLYYWVWFYYDTPNTERLMIKNEFEKVSNLMDLNINMNKIIPK